MILGVGIILRGICCICGRVVRLLESEEEDEEVLDARSG